MDKLNFIKSVPILKGWSGDKKYCVTSTDGTRYLLRISPLEQFDRKRKEFEMMREVFSLHVPMCQPIGFGVCNEGVYSLQSWIDGKDAEEIIPNLSSLKQYAYGINGGAILKRIHSIPAPKKQESWEYRFNCKIDRKIQMYSECTIKYEGGQHFIDYINENRYLLNNRPQCYQHGDYHIGNMMINSSGELTIIDFDRDDYGDPWEEFNRIVWCAQKSPMFASGIINGYFSDDVPLEFWKILGLYISSNTLSSLPWAIPYGQGEIETMLNQAKEILKWFNNMKNSIPTWYRIQKSNGTD